MNPGFGMKRRLAAKRALLVAAREVRARTGKSVFRQFREMASLRMGPGHLRASEYYAYEVFDDSLYGPAAKREVVSWPHYFLSSRLNHPRWKLLCDDKLLTYALLKGLGLPFPEVHAVFHAGGRTFGRVPTFTEAAALADFLRTGLRFPAFGKPVVDSLGKGASSLVGVNEGADALVLAGGEEVDIDRYIRSYVTPSPAGYLFQQRVEPHPDIREVAGDRTCTLRMVVLLGDEGPLLHRVVLRIPTGRNVTDNFAHGVAGNAKASINPRSGVAERAVQGVPNNGASARHLGLFGVAIHSHPDTGKPLVGFRVPDWDETVELCLRAATAFPELHYQCWDIAPSAQGPMIVELNARGFISQMPGGPGFNDDQFRRFFASYSRT
jgi:hypothetical protein